MSKYNNSFGFLLNTENIDPLLESVNKLSQRVEQNAEILNRLTYAVDNDFKFPELPIDIENTKTANTNDKEQNDPLRLLLNQKYKLDKVSIEDDLINRVENTRIKQLLLDNEKLRRLQVSKKKANTELYGIIQEYEAFIIETMQPRLKNDIEIYRASIENDLKTKDIPSKFAATEKLWSRYITYINHLEKLSNLCDSFMKLFEDKLNSKEILTIEQKLISINELKSNLKSHLSWAIPSEVA